MKQKLHILLSLLLAALNRVSQKLKQDHVLIRHKIIANLYYHFLLAWYIILKHLVIIQMRDYLTNFNNFQYSEQFFYYAYNRHSTCFRDIHKNTFATYYLGISYVMILTIHLKVNEIDKVDPHLNN